MILAYSSGAPSMACKTLLPLHENTSPSKSNPKFEIRTVPGHGRIRITLGSNEGFPFMGFIINARDVESGEIIGEFVDIPNTVQGVQCTPGINVSITIIIAINIDKNKYILHNFSFIRILLRIETVVKNITSSWNGQFREIMRGQLFSSMFYLLHLINTKSCK